jgi:hypothetical protein
MDRNTAAQRIGDYAGVIVAASEPLTDSQIHQITLILRRQNLGRVIEECGHRGQLTYDEELSHFDQCLNDEDRAEYWQNLVKNADAWLTR